jgi:multiple antibiotic resistance protein
MQDIINSFISFVLILNPFAVVSVFISLTSGMPQNECDRLAKKATIVAGIVLVIFGIFGDHLLSSLGIALPSFQVAGGLLLLFSGIEMVFMKSLGVKSPTEAQQRQSDDIAVFPIAIPMIAGPGSITTTILATRKYAEFNMKIRTIVIILFALLLNYMCLRSSGRIKSFLKETGMNVMTRMVGVIICSLAFEMILEGLRKSLFCR